MREEEIREKAQEYNSHFFNNFINLDEITFRVSNRMTRTRGKYKSIPSQEIVLSHYVLKDEVDFEKTLIHELVHAYQFQNNEKMGHGFSFKRKAQEIAFISKGEVTISRTNSFNNEEVREEVNQKRVERIGEQYAILSSKGKVNFIKNLTKGEIDRLKNLGYNVYNNKKKIGNVRHCKNLAYFLKARYFYKEDILEELELEEDLL